MQTIVTPVFSIVSSKQTPVYHLQYLSPLLIYEELENNHEPSTNEDLKRQTRS